MAEQEKPWLNGEPYYCAKCGAGGGERMACEEPDCELETAETARSRHVAAAFDSYEQTQRAIAQTLQQE